jgi:hypothetical protein
MRLRSECPAGSSRHATRTGSARGWESTRGQSVVEFALIFPFLIMLLIVLADFGRVFAAGLVVEGAARDAAEVAALEYAQSPPGDPLLSTQERLTAPAPDPGDPIYYDALALKAARTACADMRVLPNTTFNSIDGSCPTWPLIRVCVHDGVTNNGCGQTLGSGFSTSTPSQCDAIPPPGHPSWSPAQSGGTESSRYVEVRVCYPFTTMLGSSVLPFTELYIQRGAVFSIPCFLDPATASC